jgi:hypothetical protein
MVRGLEAVRLADAASVPFLNPDEGRALQAAVERLPFRRARPLVGSGENAVTQDFSI